MRYTRILFTLSMFVMFFVTSSFAGDQEQTLTIKSASTIISTNIDTNDDSIPSFLGTTLAVNPTLGMILFANQFEIAPTLENCVTSFNEDGIKWTLVQGTLVLNLSRNNNEADQIIIELDTFDVCFSTESLKLSAHQEGHIDEATGRYENATGSFSGDFVGTIRAFDLNESHVPESFSNVMGTSELTISY